MKPKRSELAASLKGSLKKKFRKQFLPSLQARWWWSWFRKVWGTFIWYGPVCMWELQMTTVWVKNSHWETKTEIPLRIRKQKYFQSCSICPLPLWAFPCFLEHHPSVSSSQSVPQATSPQCAGPCEGPEVKFGKYILFSSPESHNAHQHIRGLELLPGKNSASCALPTGWECKLKMLLPIQFCEDPASSHCGHSPTMAWGEFRTEKKSIVQAGFPGGSVVKESTCQGRRCRFDPWVGKIPWRRK